MWLLLEIAEVQPKVIRVGSWTSGAQIWAPECCRRLQQSWSTNTRIYMLWQLWFYQITVISTVCQTWYKWAAGRFHDTAYYWPMHSISLCILFILQVVISWEGTTFTLPKATCNMQKAMEYAICQPRLVEAMTFNRYICQKRYFSLVDIWEVRELSLTS